MHREFESKYSTNDISRTSIIRILFMVPVYSITSFLSVLLYQSAIYFQLIAEAYAAFALLTFFQIVCHFTGPTVHEQKDYFRGFKPGIWKVYLPCVALPLTPKRWRESGPFRTPRSGLTWFNINYVGVSQYAVIRVITAIVSITAELTGRYCQSSLHPLFARVWVYFTIFQNWMLFCVSPAYTESDARSQ